ncbi:hypothetical protein ABGT15_04530 [Flavobacterium enshiense]|uniref:hypothetical protein n=1 Tax=Flavobacterium enshiense TaxID=1341165 RepID=UPI00345DF8EB
MEIVIFSLIAYGITNILVYGSIFQSLRDFLMKVNPKFLGKLLECPMCTSYWVGFGLCFIIVSPIGFVFNLIGFWNLFLTGCFTSGCVWIIHTIQEWFERN